MCVCKWKNIGGGEGGGEGTLMHGFWNPLLPTGVSKKMFDKYERVPGTLLSIGIGASVSL